MRCLPALTLLVAIVLSGCAVAPAPPQDIADWQPLALPGKAPTRYEWSEKDGRRALMARAERSASMFRKRFVPARAVPAHAQFSWWVQDLIPTADLGDIELGDAPARVLFGFDGDVGSLSLKTRMMFDLAQALTGEQPPYATLMYVWDAKRPVGTVLTHPRSDRIRKIVVDSGTGQLRRWRDHHRDLAADFKLAFGEEPGPLVSVAFMTDSDNTASQARAWYGAVDLR